MRKASILGQKAQHDEMLAFISDYHASHGYSPTMREIGNALHYESTATVSHHLRALKRKGLMTLGRNQPRTMVLTDEGRERVRARKELLGEK